MRFIDKLRDAQQQKDSWLCVGLDPNPELIPPGVSLKTFCQTIIDATHEQACSFKFNLAFFLIYGPEGYATLADMIAAVPDGIPVILDAKFGDIDYTAQQQKHLTFDLLKAHAVTLTPYIGIECILPFLQNPDAMVLVLVRSANRFGNDFQTWPSKESPLFRYVTAELNTLEQRYPGQIGVSAAATLPRDLARIRSWAPNLPFLIPGVGVQEGDLRSAVQHGATRTGIGPIINLTRAISHASSGADFGEQARAAAEHWVNAIRRERDALRV
ncbi:MAG: orotidine-5'-phosphate decarboxylase [Chloroflexi bacterium]|nr:orotidine-5'-phosphate decarboxylase [Chloroflexota bacterium]